MLTPELRHKHTGLQWDWEKIKYSDLDWAPTSSLWTQTFTTVASFGLWTTKVTCWFKPKVIQIMTIINNQASWNYVSLTDISWYTMFYYTTSGWYFIVSTTNIIDILDNLWNSTLGTIVSIDNDWFTVNLSRNFIVTQSMITCIW